MNKTILIIGAGFGQVPAIQAAKDLGLNVIAVDKNIDAIGMKMADFAYDVDIIDFEGVLEIAKKHKIDGVMTMQSDLPVPTIGYINDTLRLKGVSLEVANTCSNKNETRLKLKEKIAAQPLFEIISSFEELEIMAEKIGFPCVVKAPDSSGSRGVTKVDKKENLKNAFDEALKYSRQSAIIVEEFIDGIEFGAQTFSVAGRCELVLLHNDTMSPPPFMIPIGHSFPFDRISDEETKKAIEDIKNAVEAVGIADGPANIDLILDSKSKSVKVIEIGARIGATCLPELVYYHTGIDWVKQTILNSIGEPIDLNLKEDKPVAALIIEAPKDGKYSAYNFDTNYDPVNLLEFEITALKGEEINILRKGTDRIGKLIAYGDSVEDAERKVMDYRNNLHVIVE